MKLQTNIILTDKEGLLSVYWYKQDGWWLDLKSNENRYEQVKTATGRDINKAT